MKIKTAKMSYDEVLALPAPVHKKPVKQRLFFRLALVMLSVWDLWMTHFTYRLIGMERLGRGEPCLVLMNHSSFIDLKIASRLMCTRPFHIVCTSDGFVGKKRLMRLIGCIPARKFMTDVTLVRDMVYAVKELKSSILMYPEASYSFDGTQTPLPESIGKCLKLLKVPVVMIRTQGAFARDPLYNNLQLRKVRVSADVEYLLSAEEIAQKTAQELNELLRDKFTFDYFRWQQENQVRIKEPFRADGLNRMLYKCPRCRTEGQMLGQGTTIRCKHCGKEYELTEYGFLRALPDGLWGREAEEEQERKDERKPGEEQKRESGRKREEEQERKDERKPEEEQERKDERKPEGEQERKDEQKPEEEQERESGRKREEEQERKDGRKLEETQDGGFVGTGVAEEIEFTHIPDWYRWERGCVRAELESGAYRMEAPVAIYVMVNMNRIYQVGEGTLTHTREGFHLTGCDGRLDYVQEPLASYSLYSDFYWYEIGDVISIGDDRVQYYCFPKDCGDIVAKARLATEELYKMAKEKI